MKNKTYKRISVKHLIDTCMKQGGLSSGYASRTRALDGIREHTRVQGLRPQPYKKEVAVSHRINGKNIDLEIYGRVDGVFESSDPLVVEEIKTCRKPAEQMAGNPDVLHLAQLKCYGYMIAHDRGLKKLVLQLTYVRTGSGTIAEKKEVFTLAELESFFISLTSDYISMLEDQINWKKTRNNAIKTLPFPYPGFRSGQRLLAESVYKIIKNQKLLFARAPTGTGKTIATLFPAIKSLGLGQIDRIFYLTAKTVGRTVAVKALEDMRAKGLKIKYVIITAKQKTCFVSDETCEIDSCPFAENYYGKLKQAMKDITAFTRFDRENIEALAKQYQLCPFELSLDISLVCDVIICDLNYCFDPRVYLRRYFEQTDPRATFLVDEAHNLSDRLRSMYSALLLKSDVLKTQRVIRQDLPEIAKSLVIINKQMLKLRRHCIDKGIPFLEFDDIPPDLLDEVKNFAGKADRWLDTHQEESPIRSVLLEFYFQASIFTTIAEFFDTHYRFYVERIGESDLLVRLYCLDPSPVFSNLIHRCCSCTFFSATLSPVDYHKKMLFTDEIEPFAIELPSPFPRENFGLFLHKGIQTTYRTRHRYYNDIAQLIKQVTRLRKGNYLIYFPSYAFMENVLSGMEEDRDNLLIQHPDMTEDERADFLVQFETNSAITGFAVMGGIFGEGIDLTGDRLVGAVIISAGVPQVCPEQDLIREYHDFIDNSGFFKSYQMPGFNRVMQAAGRVIRTAEDKGIVILVDERFNRPDYRCLFPPEWQDVKVVSNTPSLVNQLKDFWKDESSSKLPSIN